VSPSFARRLAVAAALLLGSPPPPAAAAEPSAVELLRAADELRRVDRAVQKVRMTVSPAKGAPVQREFEVHVRRDADAVRSWTRLQAPADLAGTQLVVVDRPDAVDDLLVYLPALKRVSRISGRARSGAFLSSDFSFEDLEISGVEGAQHRLVPGSPEAWVIESRLPPGSTYEFVRSTLRRADLLPVEVAYHAPGGAPLKVLRVLEEVQIGGRAYPRVLEMAHLQRGSRTRLEILEQRADLPATAFPDEMFTAAWMEAHR
jgi:hypothetical protein